MGWNGSYGILVGRLMLVLVAGGWLPLACGDEPTIGVSEGGDLVIMAPHGLELNAGGEQASTARGRVLVNGADLGAGMARWERFFQQNPTLIWEPSSQRLISDGLASPTELQTADLDGDGDVDVFAASFSTGMCAYYLNHGSGNWTEHALCSASLNISAVLLADLDDDGETDLVVADYGRGSIFWYRNQGNATFSSAESLAASMPEVVGLASGDINGDGRLDIVSCSMATGFGIVVFRGLGSGSFSESVLRLEPSIALALTNVDQSMGLDIVISDGEGASLIWLPNSGNFSYSTARTINNALQRASAVTSADLDNDGTMDLLVTDAIAGQVLWYHNDGTGRFAAAESLDAAGTSPFTAKAADLTGDGFSDIVSTDINGNSILFYRNLRNGSFAAGQHIDASAPGAQPLSLADVDGDGNIDVLSGLRDGHRLVWYRNDYWL